MKDNIALEQELVFEKKMRNRLIDLMQKAAKENGWRVYELTEEAHDGPPFIFISYQAWEDTPYEKRPPRSDDITFIVVVNKDALEAWKNWRVAFQSKFEEGTKNYAANVQTATNDDPLLKAYMDSANYYSQLGVKYSLDHEEQYLKDLKADNKTALKEHENNVNRYADKFNYFIKKYQDEQNGLNSKTSGGIDQLQKEELQKTTSFTEESIVLVHFMINPYLVKSGLEDGGQHSLVPQFPLKINGASYAGLLVNKAVPDIHSYDLNYMGYIFISPAAVATIMFGNYLNRDIFNNYTPSFLKILNKNAVIGSEKAIKCDVLQNFAVNIEGGDDKVRSVIKGISWDAINLMMGK